MANVLLGVVRSPKQLAVNREHRFYHIPAKLVIGDPSTVEYVAIYQSKRLFGSRKSGIQLLAKVESVQRVSRGDITELPARDAREPYCRFDTGPWERLKPPIRARGPVPTVNTRTSLFLLRTSRDIAELYIADARQYRLHRALAEAAARSRKVGGTVELPGRERYRVLVYGDNIGIYAPGQGYHQIQLAEFYRDPTGFLQKMHKYVQIM